MTLAAKETFEQKAARLKLTEKRYNIWEAVKKVLVKYFSSITLGIGAAAAGFTTETIARLIRSYIPVLQPFADYLDMIPAPLIPAFISAISYITYTYTWILRELIGIFYPYAELLGYEKKFHTKETRFPNRNRFLHAFRRDIMAWSFLIYAIYLTSLLVSIFNYCLQSYFNSILQMIPYSYLMTDFLQALLRPNFLVLAWSMLLTGVAIPFRKFVMKSGWY